MRLFLLLIVLVSSKKVKLPGSEPLDIHVAIDSGYLKANQNGTWRMFYLLVESIDTPPATSPLIVWLNGGPGCSSIAGMFEELGPYYVGYKNLTLFKNQHTWNRRANILYLESPIGVGFSYNTEVANFSTANDDTTLEQNFNALEDFFGRNLAYKNRSFFITGESYAGVYLPMLAAKIIEAGEDFPNRQFQGMAIGNGYMNAQISTNTLVLWSAYHGRIDEEGWEQIKESCKTDGATDVDSYDFTRFMSTNNSMDYTPDNSTCGQLLKPLVPGLFDSEYGSNFYNLYSDCYYNFSKVGAIDPIETIKNGLLKDDVSVLLNNFASDTALAYQCWADIALERYMNSTVVRDQLGIDKLWRERNETWNFCNNKMYENYTMTYTDNSRFFESIVKNSKKPFRILLYNGDVDTACNYLADQKFIRQLAKKMKLKKTSKHQPWYYEKEKRRAGYVHSYEGEHVSIDVLTVKGSGHFVPYDRPGPALQMINNFISTPQGRTTNYTNFKFDT